MKKEILVVVMVLGLLVPCFSNPSADLKKLEKEDQEIINWLNQVEQAAIKKRVRRVEIRAIIDYIKRVSAPKERPKPKKKPKSKKKEKVTEKKPDPKPVENK